MDDITPRVPLRPLPDDERAKLLAQMGQDENRIPLDASPEERKAAMSDSLPAVQPSTGLASSEGKFTALVLVVGTFLEAVAIPLLEHLKDSYPNAHWIAIVLVVCGVLLQIASLLGYQKQRTALKMAALSQPKP